MLVRPRLEFVLGGLNEFIELWASEQVRSLSAVLWNWPR
jgi:hypothetical protein